MQQEGLTFSAHRNLLVSVIEAQAGSLQKALLEGVMNSIDAGATRIGVRLTADRFVLRDDGRGFSSRQEVVDWFGQFGTPHVAGDATYGRFCMGRGQLFAFGQNRWRTGSFRMEVDVRQRGLDYTLTSGLPRVSGCRIDGTLYQPLDSFALEQVASQFCDLVRYAQVPVRLNGRCISVLPSTATWDLETADAYFKLRRSGELAVYNLGVLVCKYPAWEYGCGGVVVSKQPLRVNFARNDILSSQCETWQRIERHLRQLNLQQLARKTALTPDERTFLARHLAQAIPGGLACGKARLFTDATGRHVSLDELRSAPRLCVAPENDLQRGARLHRQGAALVLSAETLTRFRVNSLASLLRVVGRATGSTAFPPEVDYLEAARAIGYHREELAPATLPPEEQAALAGLQQVHPAFHRWLQARRRGSGLRELRVGVADACEAWTDGKAYIVLHRDLLTRAARRGSAAFLEALLVLVHEYVHDEADHESHDHEAVFYREHHDIVQQRGGQLLTLAEQAARQAAQYLRRVNAARPLAVPAAAQAGP